MKMFKNTRWVCVLSESVTGNESGKCVLDALEPIDINSQICNNQSIIQSENFSRKCTKFHIFRTYGYTCNLNVVDTCIWDFAVRSDTNGSHHCLDIMFTQRQTKLLHSRSNDTVTHCFTVQNWSNRFILTQYDFVKIQHAMTADNTQNFNGHIESKPGLSVNTWIVSQHLDCQLTPGLSVNTWIVS